MLCKFENIQKKLFIKMSKVMELKQLWKFCTSWLTFMAICFPDDDGYFQYVVTTNMSFFLNVTYHNRRIARYVHSWRTLRLAHCIEQDCSTFQSTCDQHRVWVLFVLLGLVYVFFLLIFFFCCESLWVCFWFMSWNIPFGSCSFLWRVWLTIK